jgi:nitroimidazol reductase NimA-like FMN-containing flavoprotein (pyridoxamine 5'-phosphate oxidase superfamily)
VPLAYGYDGESVYAHSGPGRKLDLMRAEPRVTFEVDAAQAPDRWRSVIAEGTFEEIHDAAERNHALRAIYPPPAAIPDLGPRTVVFRIRLTSRSGRYETPE